MKVPTQQQLLIFKSGVAPVMSPVLDGLIVVLMVNILIIVTPPSAPECWGWIVAGVSSNFSPDCLPRMSLVPHKLGHKAPPSFVRNIGHLQHSPLSADEFSIFPSQRQATSGIVLPSFKACSAVRATFNGDLGFLNIAVLSSGHCGQELNDP